jgi:hypothetical protein
MQILGGCFDKIIIGRFLCRAKKCVQKYRPNGEISPDLVTLTSSVFNRVD